jgi:hypothetical protein
MSTSVHPLLGLWIVQSPDETMEGGWLPLVGRSDEDLFVLAYRDLPRARTSAGKLELGERRFQLVCDANLGQMERQLRSLGVKGVVLDWDPAHETLGDTRSLDFAAA